MVEIRPVLGIGDIVAGDDLAEVIAANAPWLADGDILVVTSKIVSKAEGRLVEVPADGPEREAAKEAALVAESARVVARRGPTTIVETHQGFVMAAAGIDASNVDKTHLVLLPADPDASARRLRAGFRARGLDVAVIVSDTMGRTWRNGLTDVALGAAGIAPFRDHRGETDPYGNELQITQMALIDELAAAGELVKGKVAQVPVAVVRGLLHDAPQDSAGGSRSHATAGDSHVQDAAGDSHVQDAAGGGHGHGTAGDGPGAAPLLRDSASDMFRLGTDEARAAGLLQAARLPAHGELPGHPTDPAAVARALDAVAEFVSAGFQTTPAEPSPTAGCTAALHVHTHDASPAGWMRLGADAQRLQAALAAERVVSVSLPHEDGIRLELSGA
ncbi:coenzyme F420-0:L-glutamate ligase [Actinoplanes sp. TBRC 11911]|nr:coenzyme F420-0:L-glutamate ligase [Actinoplanes sp. TBRC 11911]NMO50976.1 coenzyme F420-0:L-glutamate ligase [Actinoplanes sp. TBRC 11911]